MERLALYLLGTPRMERKGKPVQVDTRKAIALIAYLALTHEPHSRDALAALLYPESDQTKARAALRRTLSTLKQALGEDWLDVDRETIGLNPSDELWIDVNAFQTYLAACRKQGHVAGDTCSDCMDELEQAVALYRDDFLAGFTLRDSPDFDDWQFFQAESLRRELIATLGILSCCFSQRGAYEKAIGYTRRWLALDPLDEPAQRQLMRLYAWSGQRAAALRQYRECVRLFDHELGVAPLEETTRLYEAIEGNRLEPPPTGGWGLGARGQRGNGESGTGEKRRSITIPFPSPTPSPQPLTPTPYPLVGRGRELRTLLDAFNAIRADGHLIGLEGEAGIGKTRLAEEFLAQVRARGTLTITARSYEGESTLAYGLFVEGLRAVIQQSQRTDWLDRISPAALSEAARLLPELAVRRPELSPAPPLDSPGAQARFFDSVSQLLMAVCSADTPGIFFLDDLQWADVASLDLLTYVARRLHGHPLCILAAWRTEQVSTEHRLRQLVAETQRAGTGTLIRLAPLTQSAVSELVQTAHGGATPALSDRLWHETEGHPFFLVQYLTHLASGELPEEGDWSLPGGVRDLLHSHLNRVSGTARQLLGAAAVIGRAFDLEALRQVSGRDESEMVNALEELLALGLIVEVKGAGDGAAVIHDFQHEKLRTFVHEELSLVRRRLLHRRAAQVLVERARLQHNSGPLANQIAQHYHAAGQDREAAEYSKLAGDYARGLYANAEALEHYRSALALGYDDTAGLHEAIGDLQTLAGEYGAALNSYQAAAALHEGTTPGQLEWKIANVYLRRGNWELAENHFQTAANLPGTTTASERARIYADWSLAAHRHGHTEQAQALARQALELAQAAGDQRMLAQAHNIVAILARARDDLDLAFSHLEQSMTLAETLSDSGIQSAALNNLALVSRDRGEIERGIHFGEMALALSKTQGDRHREAALHNNLADLMHAAGRTAEAMEHLKQAVAIYAEIGVEAGMWQPEIWKLAEW